MRLEGLYLTCDPAHGVFQAFFYWSRSWRFWTKVFRVFFIKSVSDLHRGNDSKVVEHMTFFWQSDFSQGSICHHERSGGRWFSWIFEGQEPKGEQITDNKTKRYMLCQVSEMLGKIEEISKETKELGGSSRDVRPAMAVAKFQPVLQRKQRGRMKKLVTIFLEMFICSFIFRHCLTFPYLKQTHWILFSNFQMITNVKRKTCFSLQTKYIQT